MFYEKNSSEVHIYATWLCVCVCAHATFTPGDAGRGRIKELTVNNPGAHLKKRSETNAA